MRSERVWFMIFFHRFSNPWNHFDKETSCPARRELALMLCFQKRITKIKTNMAKANTLGLLEKAARRVRDKAYAPYSNFQVGAALESTSGKVFEGCNVENISFGLTICAERNAVFAAIAAGVRSFRRIVVVADSTEPVTPCGACRQVLSEFAEKMEVISINLQGRMHRAKLSELLPRSKAGILDHQGST